MSCELCDGQGFTEKVVRKDISKSEYVEYGDDYVHTSEKCVCPLGERWESRQYGLLVRYAKGLNEYINNNINWSIKYKKDRLNKLIREYDSGSRDCGLGLGAMRDLFNPCEEES